MLSEAEIHQQSAGQIGVTRRCHQIVTYPRLKKSPDSSVCAVAHTRVEASALARAAARSMQSRAQHSSPCACQEKLTKGFFTQTANTDCVCVHARARRNRELITRSEIVLRRIHFVELEDLPWLPAVLRDGVTDFLEFMVVKTPLYDSIAPRLARALALTKSNRIVDLCSGGGGAWLRLLRDLPAGDLRVSLSDIYPNRVAFERIEHATQGRVAGITQPVDATKVESDIGGFRTLFSSFHHLRPAQARAVLLDAVENGSPIAIFESTQRHILLILYMLLTPLIVLLVTPFMKSVTPSRLVFTYLIPLIPLIIAFDGVVSCLRTYTPAELRDLVDSLPENNYAWDIALERMGALPIGVTYLIGIPEHAERV